MLSVFNFLTIISLFLFLICVIARFEGHMPDSRWPVVFLPLFLSDFFVAVGLFYDRKGKSTPWCAIVLGAKFIFQILLSLRLQGIISIPYVYVIIPALIGFVIIAAAFVGTIFLQIRVEHTRAEHTD